MKQVHFVYILECANGHFYTGSTDDPARRFRMHLGGKGGAKYTRSFPPKRIAQCWSVPGPRSRALRIECGIKRLSRREKELLVDDPRILRELLPDLPVDRRVAPLDPARLAELHEKPEGGEKNN